ncbi:MAG: alcohol dehydrogenase catalytic domain-containing protein, partial [Psychrobium sp.]
MPHSSLPSTFNAVELSQFGDVEQLALTQVSSVPLAANEIRVKNIATSINPIDFKTRQGLGWAAQENADKLPMILGYDVIGTVVEVGTDVSEFKVD